MQKAREEIGDSAAVSRGLIRGGGACDVRLHRPKRPASRGSGSAKLPCMPHDVKTSARRYGLLWSCLSAIAHLHSPFHFHFHFHFHLRPHCHPLRLVPAPASHDAWKLSLARQQQPSAIHEPLAPRQFQGLPSPKHRTKCPVYAQRPAAKSDLAPPFHFAKLPLREGTPRLRVQRR